MTKPLIPGGYILLSRNLLESDIWDKPPLYLKVWVYLLSKAQHQDYKNLKRGQLRTSIPEIQEAMSYMVGYRKQKPSRKQVWSVLEWLRNTHLDSNYEIRVNGTVNRTRGEPMIVTTKGTHGIVINIVNYGVYQEPKNYEGNNGRTNEKDTNGTRTERQGNNINKNDKNEKNDKKNKYSCAFEEFWKEYPRKIEKIGAYKNWQTRLREGYKPEQLITAAKNYAAYCKQNGTEIRYMKHPKTFIGPSKPFEEFLKPIAIAVEQKPKEPKTFWDNDYTFKGERTEKERKVTSKPEEGQEIIIADFDKLIDETLEKMSKPKNKKGDVK
jgi:hypothetical protein